MKCDIRNAAFAMGVSFLVMAGVPAHAEVLQRTVSYGDLDLSRPDAARILIARLGDAAAQVCGGEPDGHAIGPMAAYRSCRQKALKAAVARIGSPVVTALYGNSYPQVASDR